MRKFDLIIFGATGFTGRYVVERFAQTVQKFSLPTRWAIAVRNTTKMKQYLGEMEASTGIANLKDKIPIIEANGSDVKSMSKAFQNANLVMNCIGPYSLLGEPVVKACIDSKTHYMDLAGEPLFLESIQCNYNAAAARNQVYVVGSCGFDSIPADIGTQYLKQKFPGHLHQVEHLLELWYNERNRFSYATWIALIEGYKHAPQLKRIRKELFSPTSSVYKPYSWIVPQKRSSFKRSSRGYIVPFPGSDRSVVKRTQLHRYSVFNELPTQLEAYYCIRDLKTVLRYAAMGFNLSTFTKYEFTERLLRKYGDFFSLGTFEKGKMPDRQMLLENQFKLTLLGRGWPKKIADSDKSVSNMTQQSAVIIRGGDGAYIETATIAINTALVLLEEIYRQQKNTTLPYGVITPGSIIPPEALVNRLNREGRVVVDFVENYQGE